MIWSDQWAAYNGIVNLPGNYGHQTVNHSVIYVDPNTGCQTNNFEARWNACKVKFKAMFGVHRHVLPSYLDEHMWRGRRDRLNYFDDIVQAIRQQYHV